MAETPAARPVAGATATFPLPVAVIDALMPGLRDTELRVLLVVLRQTWGRGKEKDWLSHTQLKARTGRAGEAVSGAVDALVRRGALTVTGTSGALLTDAAIRRRERSRLYFAPGPLLHAYAGRQGPTAKAKTTDTTNKERPLRKPEVTLTPRQQERIEEQKRRIWERLEALRP